MHVTLKQILSHAPKAQVLGCEVFGHATKQPTCVNMLEVATGVAQVYHNTNSEHICMHGHTQTVQS